MKSTTKILALGGSALVLASLGLAIARGPARPAPAGGRAAAEISTSTAEAARPDGHGLPLRAWRAGATYVYAIESARTIAIEGSKGAGRGGASTLAAELSISVVEETDDGVRLRFAIADARQGAADAPELRVDARRIAKGFYANAAHTGEVRSFAFAADQSPSERAAMKAVAASLELAVPSRGATVWQATEQDASGEYEARYRVAGDRIHKSKDHYLRTRGARGLVPVRDPGKLTVASSIDLALDASGWPRTVDEDETLTINAGASRFVSRAKVRAKLVRVEQKPDLAAIVAAEEGSLVPEPEADAEAFATAKRQADEGLGGGATHAALLQGFRAGDVHARNAAMGKMAALLRLHPEEAAKTREAVLHGDLDLEGKQRLVGALGAAGTKEARGALASVLGAEDAPVAVRANAAASLGLSGSPTMEDAEALVKGSSSADAEVASASTLGLGNLAKRMNDAASGDPADVIAKLVERLHAATTDEERALCLNALGNTGDARALPAIEEYLAAADTTLRATAVKALRFFEGDEADQGLRMGLQDPAPQVQLAAAAALSFRAITPLLPTIEALMKSDASEDLRLALVKSMWSRRKQDTGVMAVLTWTAAHDPSEKVRDAASKALAS